MNALASEKLPRKTKILYGAGDFGFSLALCYLLSRSDHTAIRQKLASRRQLEAGAPTGE